MKRTRILLGDDHALILNGIRTLLEPHYDVVDCVADGRQLVQAALRLHPDLVILDISMPQLNGLEAGKQIMAALPGARLIFLSMHANPLYLRKAIELGAQGYVLKAGVVEELLQAIREVRRGKVYVSPGFGQDVIDALWNRSGEMSRQAEELTDRQREILQLIAEGRLSKEIAEALGISIKTVDFHRARMMTRLGAHTAAELVRLAVERGLIAASG